MEEKKSITLLELILSIVLLVVVILGINNFHAIFVNFTQRDIYRGLLYQNTSYSLERIQKDIREAGSLEITPAATLTGASLKLNKKLASGATIQSEYYLDQASKELRYRTLGPQ